MKKHQLTLVEVLCMIALMAIIGSFSARLFAQMRRHSINIAEKSEQQNQLLKLYQATRQWARLINESAILKDGEIIAGNKRLYQSAEQMIFQYDDMKVKMNIPLETKINFALDSAQGSQFLIIQSQKKSRSFSLTLKLGDSDESKK